MGQQPRTILFVICINNEKLFVQAHKQLTQLIVPTGFEIEVMEIRNSSNMARSYNKMAKVEATYKIYIHQDTFIIYNMMLIDLHKLFEKYPELGMIGLSGCKKMPADGVWWGAESLVGQVIEHRKDVYSLLKFDHGALEAEDYVPVESIDGYFMATRVDIPWREDLFDGFHFYDSSHSMEMQRAGYVVGVPVVQSPWCIHYNGDNYDKITYDWYRDIFVQHYLKK